jgi:hypothetical protein
MKIKYEEWVDYYNNIWLISRNKIIIIIIKRWNKIKKYWHVFNDNEQDKINSRKFYFIFDINYH